MPAAPIGYNRAMTFSPKTILVPIDFSEHSRKALGCAADLGASFRSRIVVLTVIEDRFPYPDLYSLKHPSEDFYKEMREGALNELKKAIQLVPHVKERISLFVTRGYPADKILEVAGQEKADLIVMGTHGTGGIGHIFLGSVSQKVLHRAGCPVMLVRHTAEK